MNKIVTFLISLALGVIFIVGLFSYFVDWKSFKSDFSNMSEIGWIIILVFSIIPFLIGVYKWYRVLRDFGVDVSYKDALYYHGATYGIVYLVPVAVLWADVFRAEIAKKKDMFSKGVASVFVDRLFSVMTGIVIITTGIMLFFNQIGTMWGSLIYLYLLVVLFLIFSVGIFTLFLFAPKLFKKVGILGFMLNSFAKKEGLITEAREETVKFFKSTNRWTLVRIVLLNVLHLASQMLLSWLIVMFLSQSLSFLPLWALHGITSASLETPISADLGSHDITSALVFDAMGIGRTAGAIYAFIIRGGKLLITSVGLLFLVKITLEKYKDRLLVKISSFYEQWKTI